MKIGSMSIGANQRVFIIAEAGVNHNGSLERAFELIRQAKAAGADCVKFQTFRAEDLVTLNAPKADYQIRVTDPAESQLAMLKKLEFPKENFQKLKDYCDECEILFLSTPYGFSDVDLLSDIGVEGYKVASGQLTEPVFLEYVARKGKPVILSTGMASLEDVREAVTTMTKTGNGQIVLLQCTTNYPSKIEESNIRAIQTLVKEFGLPVGYSDHTVGNPAILGAVALGACVVEKHFTLDKKLPGPDHSSSMEPSEFAFMVRGIRELEKALGDGVKTPTPCEINNAKGMKRSLVSKQKILKGTAISAEMITFKRPASGIAPREYRQTIGRIAAQDIPADTILIHAMFKQ